jgi:hypothetical protein
MPRHGDEDIRDLLRRLLDSNEDILARISALEAGGRDRFGPDEDYVEEDEFDHAADKFAHSDPSQKFGQPPYQHGDSGPVITDRGLPRTQDHPAFSRYRRDTDNTCDTFGSDVARYAASRKIKGETPTDTAINAVTRFRKSRTKV